MKIIKIVGIVLGSLIVILVGAFFFIKSQAQAKFERKYEIAVRAVPVPFPLTKQEIAALTRAKGTAGATEEAGAEADEAGATAPAAPGAGAAEDATAEGAAPASASDAKFGAIALQRAIRRGKHYLESRAGCGECHGEDLGGKIIMDNAAMGKWIAPNITRGGVIKTYKSQDWVRLIRHGVKPDGKPANMPSTDYTWFSDQEISDMVAYIRSLPPVDRVMSPSELGPISSLLIYKGDMPISAEIIDHQAERLRYPPLSRATEELGRHIANVCTGCHGPTLSGGNIIGGDPKWPDATNITFHETGLAKWSLEDFQKSLREGVRPDGSRIDPVMPVAYTKNMKDFEIEALYKYLKTVPPKPFGNH